MLPIHVFVEGAIGRWVWECRTDGGQILYGCYFDTRVQAETAALTGTGQFDNHMVYYWRPAWSKFGTEPETKTAAKAYVWRKEQDPYWSWVVLGADGTQLGRGGSLNQESSARYAREKFPGAEVVWGPPATYPTEPGAPLTWQQAQARVDAGLGVETLKNEASPAAGWRKFGLGGDRAESVGADPAEFSRRLPDQIEQVKRWHAWADATLGLISGASITATEKQNAITLKIQGLKDRLAAARGLENDRDNWKQEAQVTRTLLTTLRRKAKELVSL